MPARRVREHPPPHPHQYPDLLKKESRVGGVVRWRNWGRSVTAAPAEIRRPRDVGEVAEAVEEARRTVEEGKRELEVLVRRREDINAEISRVQDVLEALESFEAPGGGKDNGVKAGATVGAPRSGGKSSDS